VQVKAKKHLGQNFLTSENIVKKIVTASEATKTDTVIEIGPGLGILTKELAKTAKKLITIELDTSIIPHLKENLKKSLTQKDLKKIKILNTDALKFIPDAKTFKKGKYKIVANIPYYITSPLITHFLTLPNSPDSLTLLVQKEVAEKICAQTKQFPKVTHSILSLSVQLFAKPSYSFTVLAGSFSPVPKVDSAVIHLETKTLSKEDLATNTKILSIAKKAFSGKRKKLSNTLKTQKEIITKLNLQDDRPETLDLKDWKSIANF